MDKLIFISNTREIIDGEMKVVRRVYENLRVQEELIFKFTDAEKDEPWWEPCELSIEIKADTPELRRAIRKLRWDSWLGLLRLKVKAFFSFWKWYLVYCRWVRKNNGRWMY